MKSSHVRPISDRLVLPTCTTDRFVCIYADTREARHEHFMVRYRVFCEETGFEDPNAFPERAEHDRYDQYARHFLIWDRHLEQWAGAMRLVDASSIRLPSEDIAGVPLKGLHERRSRTVEFSRLCILSEYRRTVQATMYGLCPAAGRSHADTYPVIYKQEDNEVLLRLLRASFGWQAQIEHCYFIVTAALSRVLGRFGIPLQQVGPPVEHRGTRIPFRYDVREAEDGMLQTLPGFSSIVSTSDPYIRYSDFVQTHPLDRMELPAFSPGFFATRVSAAHPARAVATSH